MIEQGSPEWFAQRCGKATASRVADIMATTKSGVSALRTNYAAQLIAERLTGTVAESYTNAAMQWGTDTEPDARAAYCFYQRCKVVPAEFVPHPTISMAGASPDGYVGDDGLVEIKCPNTATHIETLLGRSVPGKYVAQIQFQLACTGRKWCDFVSFDPRMPENLKLFVRRVVRDDTHIGDIEAAVIAFLMHVDAKVKALNELSEAA
jgi:putative phage-type endonuclease